MQLPIRDTVFDLRARCHFMGIVNVTPDSFSDGGRHFSKAAAAAHALRLVEEGADIIDVGGESTRPGAEPVSLPEELRRVLPVIEEIRKTSSIPISIDTRNAAVAEEALSAGADMINDISALSHDPRMADIAVAFKVPVVLMHMKGIPETMQRHPFYTDVVGEVASRFRERISFARTAGISQIVLDPGIGFGKRLEDNLTLLANLSTFTSFGLPLLVGTSRKAFLGALTSAGIEDRLPGTIASCLIAVQNGVNLLRVHDVKEVRAGLQIAEAIKAREAGGA